MTDLTVKYFSSGMVGAPQIANNWGDLVTMLDACLVNGFALKAIDTLTFADGVAREAAGRGDPVRGVVVHCRLAGRAPRPLSGAATGLPRRPAASSQ